MFKVLDKINNPNDIKKLSINELKLLSGDVSSYIHDIVTDKGGHYSSPLGAVDLTIALHYVYNTPIDKLIWDVGHQAYAHKILTDRKKEFKSIRQYDGISGFLKIDESKYDSFGAGHASTSISAGLGFAHSRDKDNKNHQVVSVIGDGAMTGGLAYEGLNNLGFHKTQLTVVLNDNSYSISESVGALSKYLTRIVTNPTYNKLRKDIWNLTDKIPTISSPIKKIIKKTEGSLKAYLTPGILFEELGLRYIGPIDGHDIENMIKVFESIKKMNTPVLLHVHTNKSKGINIGDKDAIKYYSLSGKNSTIVKDKITYSKLLGKGLSMIGEDFSFECVTAAMGIGTGLEEYYKKYKDRYIDVGIAEEHALTYAAGLSADGKMPVIAIYSTFMQRAYDCVLHDFALQNLPGLICMDRAGLVGNDGPTHHGVFDINFLSSIPGLILTAPKNGSEFLNLIYTAIKNRLLLSIRYPKDYTEINDNHNFEELQIGSWDYIQKNDSKICILTFGRMIDHSVQASKKLTRDFNIEITIINCRFIKPIDENMLKKLVNNHDTFITIEEGMLRGGFGSSILEYFSKNNISNTLKMIGIDDNFSKHGSNSELFKDEGLDVDSIVNVIKESANVK
ncbi:MAG: 1-deoxy-D-xylulose-5-phosphate synthase [Candidatus Marinimicrobia bacterium]|nr:1-deoxy-D-xylulose-5-phosphate synthase [Candidatus Neomarinimicrobiota bacterium]|tara:strand:+ start:53882 stop:55741 length:1860 start_codon:yes stop_codon:yes gene_type:complete